MKEVNYTEAQEATIRAMVAEAGVANQAVAAAIASEIGKSTRSVIAKMGRMGLDYQRKERTTKNGGEVVSKTKLVERIAGLAGLQASAIESLNKAGKSDLAALASALAA